MPETTISQRSPLADYFNDQNKSVQRHWIVVRGDTCWWRRQKFSGGRCYWHKPTAAAETVDWVCSVFTASASGDVNSGCMRLQVTQEFCPPCIASAKVLTFFFVFLTDILVPRKKKRKCDVFFSRKIKRRIIKNAFSGAEKIKRKRNSVGLYQLLYWICLCITAKLTTFVPWSWSLGIYVTLMTIRILTK